MKSIKGLILKDLLNLNHYKTTLVATVIIFTVITVSQKDFISFLPIMIIMMIGMIALSTFSYDEIAKSDKFLLTLPTNRNEIVKAKYMLSIGLILIAALIAFIINFAISYLIFKQAPDITNSLLNILSGLFGISIVVSIQIPSIYKWGAEKGRIQMFIIIALIIAVFGLGTLLLVKKLNINFDAVSLDSFLTIFGIPIMIIITTIMYFISYKISTKIYNKKEI